MARLVRTGVVVGIVASALGGMGAVADTALPPPVAPDSPTAPVSPTASASPAAPVPPPRSFAPTPPVPPLLEAQSGAPAPVASPGGLEAPADSSVQEGSSGVIRLDGVLPFVTGEVGWVALWLETAPTGSRALLSIALPETTTSVLLSGTSNPQTQAIDLTLVPQLGGRAVDALAGQRLAIDAVDRGTGQEALVGLRGTLSEQGGRWTLEATYRSPTGEAPVSLTGWASSSPNPDLRSPSLVSPATASVPDSLSATRFRIVPEAAGGSDLTLSTILARLAQEARARGWTLRHQPHPAGGVALQVQGDSRAMTLGLEGFEESMRWHVQTAQATQAGAGLLLSVTAMDQRVGYRMEVEGVPADAAPLGITPFPAGHGDLAARRVLLTLLAGIGAQALPEP